MYLFLMFCFVFLSNMANTPTPRIPVLKLPSLQKQYHCFCIAPLEKEASNPQFCITVCKKMNFSQPTKLQMQTKYVLQPAIFCLC